MSRNTIHLLIPTDVLEPCKLIVAEVTRARHGERCARLIQQGRLPVNPRAENPTRTRLVRYCSPDSLLLGSDRTFLRHKLDVHGLEKDDNTGAYSSRWGRREKR